MVLMGWCSGMGEIRVMSEVIEGRVRRLALDSSITLDIDMDMDMLSPEA